MRVNRRRTLLVLAAAALGAIVLLLLGWFPQEPARRFLERRLQAALGPQARIGALRVWPARLYAEVDGLVLDVPAYRLEARTIRASIDRRTLFGPAVAVRSLEADGVTLLIRGDAPPAAATSSAVTLGPLAVDGVRVTGGRVRYESQAVRGSVTLEGVALQGAIGQGALDVSATGGTWDGVQPLALGPTRGRIRISPSLDLHVESFEAGLARSRLSASGPLGRVGSLQPDLAWNATVDLAEVAAPAGLGDAEGTVTARGTLRLPAEGLAATADLEAERLRRGTWSAEALRAHLTYEKGRATAALDARLLGGSAHLDGTLEGTLARGRLVAREIDLARADPSLAGRASGTVGFHGDPARALTIDADVTADGRAGATPFHVQAGAQGPVATDGSRVDLDWAGSAQASATGGRIDVQGSGRAHGALPPEIEGRLDGTLATPRAGALPLEASVHAKGNAYELEGALHGLGEPVLVQAAGQGTRFSRIELTGESIALERLAPGLAGHARLDVRGSGTLDAPTGHASVQLEDATWRGVAVGAATLEATADAGEGQLELQAPGWNASARGTIGAGRLRSLHGRLELRDTPLDGLGPLLPAGPPLGGTVTAGIDFDVPLANPDAAQAQAAIESLDVTRGSLRVRNQGPVRLAWRDHAVQVEQLALGGHGFAARASGSVDLAGAPVLDLKVAAEGELDALPVPEGWLAAGRVATDVRVQGSSSRPSVTGEVTFEDAGVSGPALPPISIASGRLELAGDGLVLPDVALEAAGGRIVLSGRIPVAAALPAARAQRDRVASGESADVRVSWTGVRAEQWPQGEGDAVLAGPLDGTLTVTGGLASLTEARARLEVPATTLRVEEVEVRIDPFGASLENGRVASQPVRISVADSAVELRGDADLPKHQFDATAKGALNLRALSPFVAAGALFGAAELDVSARGPWSEPDVRGSLSLKDASLRLRLLPQALTSINAQVVFEGGSLRVPNATAVMGGGDITLDGAARLRGGLADADFKMTGRGVTLAYPPGLRSRLDADLTLTGGPQAYLLAGAVRAVRGLYDLDIVFEQGVAAPAAPPSESPALARIALDLRVEVENPIEVRNNMTDLEGTGSLVVRGDMNAPSPVGNLEIEPAGKVYLSGRSFEIASGRLTFRGNWDPTLEIEATDLIRGTDANDISTEYEVTVRLIGSTERPGLVMTSDPPLSEHQIVSLIATGRTDGGSTALRMAVGGQAAALLAGRFTRRLRDLGLDEVSIQPELVAREDKNETGARFTFGKRLSSRLELIYSLSLQDPEARFVLLEFRPGKDIVLRGQRNDAGTYTGSIGQRFQFGGGSRKRAASVDRRVRITAVRFSGGDLPVPEAEMARMAGTKVGKRKTVWALQDDAERLRTKLIERGYLEAETGARLEDGAAVFHVRSGARYDWRVEGMTQPPDLKRAIHESLFEEEALERGRDAVLGALQAQGYLAARVQTRVEPAEGRRTLVFVAEPGTRRDPVEVVFPGAQALSHGGLLEAAGGAGRLASSPGEAVRAIERAYRAAFYLTARVEGPRFEALPGGGARITVPVSEGPRAVLGDVRFDGATLPADDLSRAVNLRPGTPYDPAAALAATDRLRERYFRAGYGNVRLQTAAIPNGPRIDIVFKVEEGHRAVLGRVVVQGLRRTHQALVLRQVRMRPGAPLDPRRLASMERRLLDLGIFSRAVTSVSDEDPATLTITLDEDDRYFGRYALSYEQHRQTADLEQPNLLEKSSAEVDFEVRNVLGWGVRTGARTTVGADERNASASMGVPSLPVVGSLTATVFRTQDDIAISPDPVTGERRESTSTQNGFEVSFSQRLPRRTDLLYGYRLEDTEVVSPDFFEPQKARTAVLRGSVIRDTRDSTLDARRGRFLSLSIDYAPRFLQSDFYFVKGLAQAFLTRSVGPFTWAQGYRLGLGVGFDGQRIRSTDRFQAGGPNSIRGYETDTVGPVDPLTHSFTGGEAVVILNQEVRYRHRSGFGLAAFYDGGNVFAKVSDFSFDWVHTLGAGLRWDSPIGLLRLDLGIPLKRRLLPFDPPEKEAAYQLFFSLGQAF